MLRKLMPDVSPQKSVEGAVAGSTGMASMYSRQKDPVFDRLLQQGRLRFGGRIYPRQAGIRKVLRAVEAGEPTFAMASSMMASGVIPSAWSRAAYPPTDL